MGPSKLFHKNRSSHSLLSSQDASDRARFQHSPSESPLNSPGFPPRSLYADNKEEDDEDEEEAPLPRPAEDPRLYQPGYPTRSQSQRSPSLLNTNLQQPTINLVGPAHSTPSSAIDEAPPDSYYRPAPPTIQPAQKEDRKKRRFFGIGSSSKDPTSGAASAKLGRSISVRKRDQLPDNYQEATRQPVRQEWSSTHVSPTDDYEPEQESEAAGLQPPSGAGNVSLVGQQDKEPLYSPAYTPSGAPQDYSHGKTATSPKQSRRHPSDRQGSYENSWTRASSIVHHHHSHSEAPQQQQQQQQQQQTPASYHPSPISATSTGSSRQFHHRSPNESLHQHWQEQVPSRPSSQQSLEPPTQGQHSRVYESQHTRGNSSQTSSLSHYTQSSMGPPSQPQGPSRRPSEAQQHQQHQQGEPGREGGYQPYAQAPQGGGALLSNPPPQYTSQLVPQNPTYRGNSQPSPMPQGSHEQGRSTPPPSRSRDDLSNMDYAQLQTRHEELQDKYRKVKKYYFDKDAQVQQLQNTLAHQRLSQSRTSLDDNEYANRFSRLDGAINNLAFNLRRDWRQVPPWLAPHVNRDATTSPTKEMTAVGRAAISRWLVEELLERFFHPGLDPGLSTQLKIIERNLRRFAPPTPSDEEKDALLAKISNWRLSTLDGLQEILASPQATENRVALTEMLVEKLVAYLGMMLKEPTPAGLEGGVSMIVELAVGISANLPLESRDVFVEYVSPGQLIVDSYMKVESGLPPLTAPGEAPVDGDTASLTAKQTEETGSVDSRETGNSNGNAAAEDKDQPGGPQAQAGGAAKKKGMFGSFIGGANSGSKKGSVASTTSSAGVAPQNSTVAAGASGSIGDRKEERVRFATFMAVEVRGRSVLVKAPVYVRD